MTEDMIPGGGLLAQRLREGLGAILMLSFVIGVVGHITTSKPPSMVGKKAAEPCAELFLEHELVREGLAGFC